MKINTENNEISLRELLLKLNEWNKYIVSKWLLLFLSIIIGSIFGLVYSLKSKPIYNSKMTFAIDDESSSQFSSLGLATQHSFEGVRSDKDIGYKGSNLIELFKSRLMVQNTLLSKIYYNGKKQSLANAYLDFKGWRDNASKYSSLSNIDFPIDAQVLSRKQNEVMNSIYNELIANEISVDQLNKKNQIFTLEISSENEFFAKVFSETLTSTVFEFYVSIKTMKAKNNLTVLEQQTDSVRQELNNALAGVAVATDQTFGLNPALNVRRISTAKQEVEVKLNTAILTE